MLERIDYRVTNEKVQKVIFNEVVSATEFYTYVCEQNIVAYKLLGLRRYRVKRIVTIITDPSNRDLDNAQIDYPVTDGSGVQIINEDFEFELAVNPTTSSDITHYMGFTVTRQPLLV